MKTRIAALGTAAALAVAGGVAFAQQVPPQFVVSGKAAEKIMDYTTINLATAERIDPAVATRLATGLDESGYLRRTSDPIDRRASLVAITAKGRRALTATRDGRVGALQHQLDNLSADELRQVDAALQVLEKLFRTS